MRIRTIYTQITQEPPTFSSGFCTSFVEMAASCCSTAVFPISRPDLRCAVIWSNSVSQPQQSYRFGLSVLAPKRLQVRKSVLASSRGDNETGVVTRKSWDKLIKDSDTPVLVEFYASWCGPCRMVHRIIEEISAEYSDQLKCFILDADDDSQVAEEYDVKAVPVVMLFKNGEKRESVAGTMPKEFYVSAIERVLAS